MPKSEPHTIETEHQNCHKLQPAQVKRLQETRFWFTTSHQGSRLKSCGLCVWMVIPARHDVLKIHRNKRVDPLKQVLKLSCNIRVGDSVGIRIKLGQIVNRKPGEKLLGSKTTNGMRSRWATPFGLPCYRAITRYVERFTPPVLIQYRQLRLK